MNKKGEIIFAICVFLFVFCCSSIPIIIYATSSDVTPRQDIGVEIDINNCPQQVSFYNYVANSSYSYRPSNARVTLHGRDVAQWLK